MEPVEQSEMETTYQIGGVRYRLEPLSWQQNKWLGEHLFGAIDMQALDYAVIHDLLREKGPLLMAICLLADGEDRRTHSMKPFSAIQERAQAFAGDLTGGEVALFGPHFFRSNTPAQMAMLISGKVLQRQLERLAQSPAPGDSGLSSVSSPLPMATLPSSEPSLPSGDQPTLSRSCSVASSDAPWTVPSSDGSACSCPG